MWPGGRTELPAYRRYVDEFAALAAEADPGERSLPVTPAEELHVQESLMRACRMPV